LRARRVVLPVDVPSVHRECEETSCPAPPAEVLPLQSLVSSTDKGIASRVLARTGGGNVTLFAFDAGEELSEHTAPFDALVIVLEGAFMLTIAEQELRAEPGTIVRMLSSVPHAVRAIEPGRLLLIMLREPRPAP
jgi:quercetin dioxygenase-like cupin family protein